MDFLQATNIIIIENNVNDSREKFIYLEFPGFRNAIKRNGWNECRNNAILDKYNCIATHIKDTKILFAIVKTFAMQPLWMCLYSHSYGKSYSCVVMCCVDSSRVLTHISFYLHDINFSVFSCPFYTLHICIVLHACYFSCNNIT